MLGIALMAGLGLGLGCVAVFALATGRWQPSIDGRPDKIIGWARRLWHGPYRSETARRHHQRRLIAAAIVAALIWAITGVPVFALIVAVAIPGLPWLLGGGKLEEDAIARLEAIQAWTRRLNDLVGTGTGLQQAIVRSVETTPAVISGEVRDLAARLQAGQPPIRTLRRFASALDDVHADEVIAALIQHLTARGDQLSEVLVDIADSSAEQIANRRAVHAERANSRLTLKVLTGFAVIVLGVGPFMGDYPRTFAAGTGQIILLAAISVLIGLLLLARAVSMPPKHTRFLDWPAADGGQVSSQPMTTASMGAA